MTINLPREQQEWLEAQIRAGAYDSVEEAVAERMHLDIEDLSWAKPLVDEARASIARGEGMTLEEHRKRIAERLDSFKVR
jgi:antitoxin ParD1/3/4